MKRRRFVQALAAAPAVAPALIAQQPVQQPLQQPGVPPSSATPIQPGGFARGMVEVPKLATSLADDAGATVTHFFDAQQLAALKRLSEVILPPLNNAPGAIDAGAPAFLDFLLSESPAERQHLYRSGLDHLNAQSRSRFKKPFSETDAAQAVELLAPLRAAWTYDEPADPLARFLRAAKQDIRTATMNSKEYSASASAGGGRRFGGAGLYWYPLD